MEPLKHCVVCGADGVKRKRISVRLRSGRTVSGIRADVCECCGERYFDLAAMEKLESARRES